MRRLATWSFTLCLGALAASPAPARADDKPAAPPATKKIDNPTYTEWAKFKVGAFVETTTETTQMGQTSTMKSTTKLVELTADKAVIESSVVTMAGGQEYAMPATKRDEPKTIEVPDVKAPEPKDKPVVKEGEETIEVTGKKVACKTHEMTMDISGMKTWSKTWLTKEIPGGMAKMESKTDGKVGEMTISSTSKTTVTKFSTGA
jgi:uncharacterized Zn-binding protein involved in type VI secretion